jgi:hypothetical protein
MYFLIMLIGYALTYPLVTIFLQYFFGQQISLARLSPRHLIYVAIFVVATLALVASLPDPALANRIQHAFAGAFAVTALSYIAWLASGVSLSKFQFFCLACLLASCFGIANELLESIMQIQGRHIFADSIEDTWYDLWANSVGA